MQGARAALKEDNTLEQSAYYDPNTLTILVNTEHGLPVVWLMS